MINLFAWCGVLLLAIVAVAILMGAYAWAVQETKELWDRWKYIHAKKTQVELGNRIKNAAWWMSEDEGVKSFLMLLGDHMTQYDYVEMEILRTAWRNRKKT